MALKLRWPKPFELTIKVVIGQRIPLDQSGVSVSATDITYGQTLAESTLTATGSMICPRTQAVLKTCGVRIAWAWYGAVAILSLLLAPDKEAAAVFAFLGYYPIVTPNGRSPRRKATKNTPPRPAP